MWKTNWAQLSYSWAAGYNIFRVSERLTALGCFYTSSPLELAGSSLFHLCPIGHFSISPYLQSFPLTLLLKDVSPFLFDSPPSWLLFLATTTRHTTRLGWCRHSWLAVLSSTIRSLFCHLLLASWYSLPTPRSLISKPSLCSVCSCPSLWSLGLFFQGFQCLWKVSFMLFYFIEKLVQEFQ